MVIIIAEHDSVSVVLENELWKRISCIQKVTYKVLARPGLVLEYACSVYDPSSSIPQGELKDTILYIKGFTGNFLIQKSEYG